MSGTPRLLISPRAAADFEEIAEYIARDSPGQARRFIVELERKCMAVARLPKAYTLRSDLAPGLRMAVYKRYLVLFREVMPGGEVRIERILHGARDLPALFRQ